jgi:hypothetical protein
MRFTGSDLANCCSGGTGSNFLISVAKGQVSGHSAVYKFGRNDDIDTGTDPEDIWTYGGLYTYNDTPSIQYISSSDALDVGMEITVVGLDENYNEQSVTVLLNGQAQTQIGTVELFVRVFRAYNSSPIEFAGNVLIYDDTVTSVLLGVPSPTTSVKAEIRANDQQTYMALYTVPAGKTAYIMQHASDITKSNSAANNALLDIRIREFGGVFRSRQLDGLTTDGSSAFDFVFTLPESIPEKSDIRMQVRTVTTNDMGVSATFILLLVDN